MTTPIPSADPPPAGGLPPWIDPELQKHVEWRDGDIIVSVPGKSGTTWMMNIVHQLRTGGDAEFKDIYVEVPWLELVEHPGQTAAQRLERFRSMPTTRRRAFKTHAAPPGIPYVEPGPNSPDVKYVVVLRNPEEALVSLKPFFAGHSQAFFDFWGAAKSDLMRPTFKEFYDEVLGNGAIINGIFGLLAAWWPLRNKSNVRLVHFSNLKREPEATLRAVADFLGFSPTPEQWPIIVEHCSFEWMKKHQEKFELQHLLPIPMLDEGAMVRKGVVGAAREDGMTEEISRDLRRRGEAIIGNPRVLSWFYEGGPMPVE